MQLPNIIEKSGQRVLTTTQIAEAYGTDSKAIHDNFKTNKARYKEGKHFYCLSGKDLKEFKNEPENFGVVGKNTAKLYLWTERGALLHAKSLNTDKAWEVYDYLIENYFRKTEPKPEIIPVQEELPALQQTREEMDKIFNMHRLHAMSAMAEAHAAIAKAREADYLMKHPELLEYSAYKK